MTYLKKWNLIISIILVVLCSCNKVDLNNNIIQNSINHNYVIEEKEALSSAIEFMNSFSEKKQTKSNTEYIIQSVDYIFSKNSKTKAKQKDLFCYLFNFKNNNGYVVISSDKRLNNTVFLASETGNLSMKDIENIKGPLELIFDYIYRYHLNQTVNKTILSKADDGNYYNIETITSIHTKEPLIYTKWGQGNPYNYYFGANSNINMGCTAVAVGQILAYYKKPSLINIDGFNHYINWDIISNQVYTENYPFLTNLSDEWKMSVSSFLYLIGKLIGINYDNQETGATITQVKNAFRSLGSNYSYSDNYSTTKIISSLNKNNPVYIRANDSNGYGGHAWIIDGYKDLTLSVTTYDENGDIIENTFQNNDYNYVVERKYWHCNFGWSGLDNGDYQYYNMSIFDNYNLVYVYSSIFNTSDYMFNNNIKLIYNISF